MTKQSELQCWEIIRCKKIRPCRLTKDTQQACWEVVEQDAACSFNICVDCLVYLAKQEGSSLSDEEFCSILKERKENGLRQYECMLAHSA